MIISKNILMISGSGRKTGKTTLACEIIKKFSQQYNIIAIKVSSHDHTDYSLPITYQSKDITIQKELFLERNKDSSRMLNAGAKQAYFICAKNNFVIEAIEQISFEQNDAIICESGFSNDDFQPGLRIFLYDPSKDKKNEYLKKVSQLVISSTNGNIKFDVADIIFENNTWRTKA